MKFNEYEHHDHWRKEWTSYKGETIRTLLSLEHSAGAWLWFSGALAANEITSFDDMGPSDIMQMMLKFQLEKWQAYDKAEIS